MKLSEINIRDPFVLPYDGKYYLFGTPGAFAWSGQNGFDCYISDNLVDWSEPVRAFTRPDGFWADSNFWAPEVHYYHGRFYMFASFYSTAENMRRTQILAADRPHGPYSVWSEPVTPSDWLCLDGTFCIDDSGAPWCVFCHEWVQTIIGTMCAVRLKDDLRSPIGEPVTLFRADEACWPTAGENGSMVTDGPFILRGEENSLVMLWSSYSHGEYAEGIAVSDSGSVTGPWRQLEQPLFDRNGGHGMVFRAFDGDEFFIMHSPNENPLERPVMMRICRRKGIPEAIDLQK